MKNLLTFSFLAFSLISNAQFIGYVGYGHTYLTGKEATRQINYLDSTGQNYDWGSSNYSISFAYKLPVAKILFIAPEIGIQNSFFTMPKTKEGFNLRSFRMSAPFILHTNTQLSLYVKASPFVNVINKDYGRILGLGAIIYTNDKTRKLGFSFDFEHSRGYNKFKMPELYRAMSTVRLGVHF